MDEQPTEREWLEGLRYEDKFPEPVMDEREIEAGLVDELARVIADAVGSRNVPWYRPAANAALQLALDRVRDARSDEEAGTREILRQGLLRIASGPDDTARKWAHETLTAAARSPQGEDHELGGALTDAAERDGQEAAGGAGPSEPSPQGEDHEVGLRVAASVLPDPYKDDLVVASLAIAAYFSRVSPSRVGSVAVEDVKRVLRQVIDAQPFGRSAMVEVADEFLAELPVAGRGRREAEDREAGR